MKFSLAKFAGVAVLGLLPVVGFSESAPAEREVPSRAYLYQPTAETGVKGHPHAWVAVVHQPGTIRVLDCVITRFDNPSPEKLERLLRLRSPDAEFGDGDCYPRHVDVSKGFTYNPQLGTFALVAARVRSWSDRRVMMVNQGWVDGMVFNLSVNDALSFTGYTMVIDQSMIPVTLAHRFSFLKVSEADILYSEITEKPLRP